MKTAEERAYDLYIELTCVDELPEPHEVHELIESALREQDRLTREAIIDGFHSLMDSCDIVGRHEIEDIILNKCSLEC